MPSLEEYQAACKVIDDWIMEPDSDWNELGITSESPPHPGSQHG